MMTLTREEFEISNDEEAVMLSASRATSTVVDAAIATEVSRNHSGSVDEISKIRNPRQMKRSGFSDIVNNLLQSGLEIQRGMEFEKSNDKEAVVLFASRATSPVVDAINVTEVSRNHSGSVDEISNIRNPRKMKRMSLEEFLLAKGISSEKSVEIEYIRAVAPRKEENPSLHDDWVSAVDGSSRVPARCSGPSIEERAILFLEAQDRVKKGPLFKRSYLGLR
ncbi:hypothetical protein Tco_1568333 [Tanacetum coccineum]